MKDQQVGRNDLCPCGSGKKYKRCHGTPVAPSESGIRAAIRLHATPDGKAVPVLGWAPAGEDAWESMREHLRLGQESGLLDPMDNPDHWEAVGLEIHLTQLGPGLSQWSLRTAPKGEASIPVPSLWAQEWQVPLTLADMVKWVEALQGWKSVVIAPYDSKTMKFLPFGFQIWVPGQNVKVQPWGQA